MPPDRHSATHWTTGEMEPPLSPTTVTRAAKSKSSLFFSLFYKQISTPFFIPVLGPIKKKDCGPRINFATRRTIHRTAGYTTVYAHWAVTSCEWCHSPDLELGWILSYENYLMLLLEEFEHVSSHFLWWLDRSASQSQYPFFSLPWWCYKVMMVWCT